MVECVAEEIGSIFESTPQFGQVAGGCHAAVRLVFTFELRAGSLNIRSRSFLPEVAQSIEGLTLYFLMSRF